MKHSHILPVFLFISVFLLSCAAFAQTPVGQEQARNYYEDCRKKTDPRVRPETMDAFCACTAGRMMDSMSVEDIRIMGSKTEGSREKLNKMILEVYTPCMNYMVSDLVEAECLGNTNIDKIGARIQKPNLCLCMAVETGDWFTKEGRTLMRTVLEKNPDTEDPLGPVMETKEFKAHSYNSVLSCLPKAGEKAR